MDPTAPYHSASERPTTAKSATPGPEQRARLKFLKVKRRA